jgi:AraC-like DNA-binding protein
LKLESDAGHNTTFVVFFFSIYDCHQTNIVLAGGEDWENIYRFIKIKRLKFVTAKSPPMNINSTPLGFVPRLANMQPAAEYCPGPRRHASAQKIEEAIAHMSEHLDKPMRVATLSALAGLSVSHFFCLFKSLTGCTPIDYFIRLRMRRACEFLQDPTRSVKVVACLLGYSDPYYFSRLFKSVTGVAPRNYQRTIQNSVVEKSEFSQQNIPSRATYEFRGPLREAKHFDPNGQNLMEIAAPTSKIVTENSKASEIKSPRISFSR